MYHLLLKCASPALPSTSPVGDAASPAGDVVASPNCGICDTAGYEYTVYYYYVYFLGD